MYKVMCQKDTYRRKSRHRKKQIEADIDTERDRRYHHRHLQQNGGTHQKGVPMVVVSFFNAPPLPSRPKPTSVVVLYLYATCMGLDVHTRE